MPSYLLAVRRERTCRERLYTRSVGGGDPLGRDGAIESARWQPLMSRSTNCSAHEEALGGGPGMKVLVRAAMIRPVESDSCDPSVLELAARQSAKDDRPVLDNGNSHRRRRDTHRRPEAPASHLVSCQARSGRCPDRGPPPCGFRRNDWNVFDLRSGIGIGLRDSPNRFVGGTRRTITRTPPWWRLSGLSGIRIWSGTARAGSRRGRRSRRSGRPVPQHPRSDVERRGAPGHAGAALVTSPRALVLDGRHRAGLVAPTSSGASAEVARAGPPDMINHTSENRPGDLEGRAMRGGRT